jgi:outer membrane protein assembly factor BamB
MRRAFPLLLALAHLQAGAAELVQYGSADVRMQVAYQWTPQGLQARLGTGAVLWSFDPATRAFRRTAAAGSGNLCDPSGLPTGSAPFGILQVDRNGDGHIDAAGGDSARIYFGGRSVFHALDVSNPLAPALLWVADSRRVPGLGAIASAPAFARLRVEPRNADDQRLVVLTGAGRTGAASGPRILALDARTGALLWSAGNAPAASLQLPGMRFDVQGGVAAVDVDGDTFADRLYAGDEGGNLWRIDLRNGATPTPLASGGALAQLEGALRGTPDVAWMQNAGARPFFSVAIAGVGWLYALRDYAPFDPQRPIRSADLAVPGQVAPDGRGWRMALAPGETFPAPTLTADGVLIFTTFIARSAAASGCDPRGDNRVYALAIRDGAAALDLDGSGALDARDRSRALAQREPVHGVQLDLPGAAQRAAGAGAGTPGATPVTCTAGAETLAVCPRAAALLRSFWSRGDAD